MDYRICHGLSSGSNSSIALLIKRLCIPQPVDSTCQSDKCSEELDIEKVKGSLIPKIGLGKVLFELASYKTWLSQPCGSLFHEILQILYLVCTSFANSICRIFITLRKSNRLTDAEASDRDVIKEQSDFSTFTAKLDNQEYSSAAASKAKFYYSCNFSGADLTSKSRKHYSCCNIYGSMKLLFFQVWYPGVDELMLCKSNKQIRCKLL